MTETGQNSLWTTPMDRIFYGQYKVGDTIIATSEQPYTGGNVFPVKGERYQLVQQDLSKYNVSRDYIYQTQGLEYQKQEDYRLDQMKLDFNNTPPIPEEDDGLHRIVVAKELGHKTILMWKAI